MVFGSDNASITSNMRHQTRLASGLIPLLNLLRDKDIPSREILRHAGIWKFELTDPAFTISFEQEIKIVERALEAIPEPHASLELAGYYHLHNFSVLGLALRSCSNLGEIFELILRYPRLVWGICETSSWVKGGDICFQFTAGVNKVERFLLERDMASVNTMFNEALDSRLQLNEVRIAHAAPADITPYEIFFNCPVYFGQPVSEMSMPLTELEKTVASADPLSKEFYEAQCARLSANIDEPFRYAYLVRDHLSHMTPMPSLEALSKKLDIEPRTLQRLMAKEGETFSSILRSVRFKRAADRLLYSHFTAEQIAGELGFNDAVAFSHAFKQWAGVSPRQWRNENADC